MKEALTTLRKAIHLQKDQPNAEIQAHLKLAERLAALEGRLDPILHGKDVPAAREGKLDVADLCRLTRRFAAAVRLYGEALRAKPALADDLTSQHRLHAAIAAAQAGTSQKPGKDATPLDDAERAAGAPRP